MERLREVLAFVNDKGGVGKTTTVQNLAAGLVRYGYNSTHSRLSWALKHKPRILIIDLDPQVAGISLLSGWRSGEHVGDRTMFEALSQAGPLPVYKMKENLYLAPTSERLLGIDPFLLQTMNPLKQLCKCFAQPVVLSEEDGGEQSIIEAFDYVLIDCPPAMNNLTKNAMAVASGFIVPMQLEALSTLGSSNLLRIAQEVKAELNPNLDFRGILKVMVNSRTNVSKGFAQYLEDEYSTYVFQAEIPRATNLVESQAQMKDIFEHAPYKSVGLAYERFVKEVVSTYKE